MLEQNKSQSERHLRGYFLQEVFKGLTMISEDLVKLKDGTETRQRLIRIKEMIASISDLSMVHGYEGVENISSKMSSILNQVISSGKTIDEHFVHKMEYALQILKQVVEMEDYIESQMTVERVSKHVERNLRKVQNWALNVSENLDFLQHKQLNIFSDKTLPGITKKDMAPIFDIAENDAVLDLVKEPKNGKRHNRTLALFDLSDYQLKSDINLNQN